MEKDSIEKRYLCTKVGELILINILILSFHVLILTQLFKIRSIVLYMISKEKLIYV